jgi:hypothetical protein
MAQYEQTERAEARLSSISQQVIKERKAIDLVSSEVGNGLDSLHAHIDLLGEALVDVLGDYYPTDSASEAAPAVARGSSPLYFRLEAQRDTLERAIDRIVTLRNRLEA